MASITLTASRDARLDVLVAEAAEVTRSQAAKWIDAGLCGVGGVTVTKAGAAVRRGAALTVNIPEAVELAAVKEGVA